MEFAEDFYFRPRHHKILIKRRQFDGSHCHSFPLSDVRSAKRRTLFLFFSFSLSRASINYKYVPAAYRESIRLHARDTVSV